MGMLEKTPRCEVLDLRRELCTDKAVLIFKTNTIYISHKEAYIHMF